ncbi:glycosyltransferase family 2 protein [Frateuria sp. MAH-13]|uniref:Glycosyltransferase family 2 protein n=1 Tax=Frateuria flava TaxID=2821489 RepID=A0ABS4DQZ0_9GAMM|nr:glycosyltransferase family 2 protein [Frateuria flava]MBP1475478.1 glycosyltransferase family 2 protein [Frateuria flava]
MTSTKAKAVCAVIVSYFPESATLRRLVESVTPQVGAVVLVDNSGSGHANDLPGLADGVHVLAQSVNVGLAAAQNLGISWARGRGYAFVLLLDQDSTPDENMVEVLLDALARTRSPEPVAAIGPRFHDPREARDAPFVRLGFPVSRKLWCHSASQVMPCDFLISSGSLIPIPALEAVGDMDAGLFIDNVDLEWCFRAKSKGYALLGVCGATMHHRLGDARRAMPLGLGHVVVHGPARLYYIMRNRLLLYRMKHTPLVWVAQDLPRILVKLFLFGVLIGPRWDNLRFMLRGLGDGLRGRRGRCPIG